MDWVAAMIIAGGLLYATGNIAQKARAWGALVGAWLLGALAVGQWGFFPPPIIAFMLIDGLAAWVVLKRPRLLGQQLIGAIFVMMLAWHIGFFFTDRTGVDLYLRVQLWLGWIQWGVLMVWGGADAGKAFGWLPWRIGAVAAHTDDIGAGGQ